nr:MAG TPA_asm: restriction alleviation protein [Caudoviricetes sp.]
MSPRLKILPCPYCDFPLFLNSAVKRNLLIL